jgi:uncharacterized protein (TIGR01777 family)
MQYLITGGTGFIGRRLTESLLADGHKVMLVSRDPERAKLQFSSRVDAIMLSDVSLLPNITIDAVVNLAGAPIADRRWTSARKALLKRSRIDFTKELIQRLRESNQRPAAFISGSAIGYFGPHDDAAPLSENGTVQEGFQHTLCKQWEDVALSAEKELGARVCCVRTGVVFGKRGGALAKMLPAFKLGLGGPMGSGDQWMSWIHVEDEVGIIRFLLDNDQLSGPFNATAPEAVMNMTFTQALAKTLNRPAFFRVPAALLKLVMGESSELLLSGQHVYPTALVAQGYTFSFPDLRSALRASV